MKTINHFFCALVFALCLFSVNSVIAQEAPTAKYYTVTTMHFNLDNDSDANWLEVEKEYLDKVTKKNEYILGSGFYTHLYTSNSTDVKYVQVYASWEDIDKAGARNGELEKAAWPDDTARAAFLKTQGDFYAQQHSDEIYSVMGGSKAVTVTDPSKDMILYVRTSHLAYPENVEPGEIGKLRTEYVENVIHKNELIKGYYPHRHFYGHDSTEFLEASFVDSMADLDKLTETNRKLVEAHWTTPEARREFFSKMNKYFTGVHGDEVYTSISALRK
jgi:hypothetical protein